MFIRYWFVCFLGIFAAFPCFSQIGNSVDSVLLYDEFGKPVQLPLIGEKKLLLFYFDPDHPGQNRRLVDYLMGENMDSSDMGCYAVVNLYDAPLLSKALLEEVVYGEVGRLGIKVYYDPANILSTNWKLGDVNNKFVVIFVNKEKFIEFYYTGELDEASFDGLIRLMGIYKKE